MFAGNWLIYFYRFINERSKFRWSGDINRNSNMPYLPAYKIDIKKTDGKWVKKQIIAFIISKIFISHLSSNAKAKLYFKNSFQQWWTNPRAEKIKTLHSIETKQDIRICSQTKILILCSHTEKVRESMFKKYFKISLLSNL